LANLLMKFPDEMLEQDPWLLFYFCMTKRFTETSENIQRLKDAFASFEKQEDIAGQLLTVAFMIEASIFGGHDIIPIVSLLRKSDVLLDSLSSDQYALEKSILYFQTGLGHCLRGGNLKRSFATSQNAYLISRGFGNIVLQVSALANELLALSFFGDFFRAKALCQEIEKLLSSCQYKEIDLLYRINLSAYLINAGELNRAKSLIESIKKDAEKYGLIYCYPVIQIYDLIMRPHLGEYEKAEIIAKGLLDLVTALDNLFLKGAALMYLGVSHYCKGEFQAAENCLDRSREIFRSNQAYSASHLIVNRIIKVLVSIHERKYETADKELKALFEINRELGSDLVAFHIHLASALLNRQKKNPEEVIFHLIHGFKIAKTNGYYHTVWMRREDFACVTYLVIELNVGEVKQYAIDLLTFHLASYGESETERLMRHPNENVRQSARLIRETIHRSKVPRVKINFLGGFGVYIVGGQEVKWEGFQAKTLLKSLIVHGSRGVATDLVMEDVWPESASNDRKFKVALHRLRKTLEPGMKKAFGSSYIHLKGGKLYLDHELVDLDVERFVTLIHKGKHHEGEGRMAQALTCYQEAVDLYRGDFLPEDRHTSWVENKQNELKNQFLDLLLRTARIHETRGSFRKATALYKKALQTDPLLEEACQRVMRLLSEQGKRSEALRVYEQFKTAVRRELGTHPDPLTDSIHRKIMA